MELLIFSLFFIVPIFLLVMLVAIEIAFTQNIFSAAKFTINIFSFLLSLLAFAPIIFGLCFYYWNTPVLDYKITPEKISESNGEYNYSLTLMLIPKNGPFLIEKLYLASDFGFTFEHRDSNDYFVVLEKSDIYPTVAFKLQKNPFLIQSKIYRGIPILFISNEKKSEIKLKCFLDISLSPHERNSFLSIFYSNFRYRKVTKITVDMNDSDITGSFD